MKKILLIIILVSIWASFGKLKEETKYKTKSKKVTIKEPERKTIKLNIKKTKKERKTNVCTYFKNCENLSFTNMIKLTQLIHNIEKYDDKIDIGPIVYKKREITQLFKINESNFEQISSCEYKRITSDLFAFLEKEDLSNLITVKDLNSYLLKINTESTHVCVENEAFLFLDHEIRKNIFQSKIKVKDELLADLFKTDLIYGQEYPLEDFIFFYETEYSINEMISKSIKNSTLILLNNINFQELITELDEKVQYKLKWEVYSIPSFIYKQFKFSGLSLYSNLINFEKYTSTLGIHRYLSDSAKELI